MPPERDTWKPWLRLSSDWGHRWSGWATLVRKAQAMWLLSLWIGGENNGKARLASPYPGTSYPRYIGPEHDRIGPPPRIADYTHLPNYVVISNSPKEPTMSYFPGMQKGNLDAAKADEHGKIKKETVALQGVSVTRVTFDAGAKWSNDLKEYAGTDSCQLPHVALVLSGTLRVVMDDGSQQDFSKNDVMLLPPGHDAWSVGNEPCVFVEFSRGNDYYTGDHSH